MSETDVVSVVLGLRRRRRRRRVNHASQSVSLAACTATARDI